jgi:hypothetical protein
VPDQSRIGHQPVSGERPGEACVSLADSPDVIVVAAVTDPPVPLVDEVADGLIGAVEVVGREVDTDHLDPQRLLLLQEAVAARDRDDDEAVNPAGAERRDDLALPGQAVVGAADENDAIA